MHSQSNAARYGVAVLAAAIVTLVGAFFLIREAGAPVHLGLHLLTGLAIVVLLIEFISKKRRNVTLRRNESELTDFFENAAVPIHWVGPGGVILRANRAASQYAW